MQNTVIELGCEIPKLHYFSTSFHYYKICLAYLYYIKISPFKIIETKGQFLIHTNKTQKVSKLLFYPSRKVDF